MLKISNQSLEFINAPPYSYVKMPNRRDIPGQQTFFNYFQY
jgi:hypothetical protein